VAGARQRSGSATLRDVAGVAGVSPSTASRVLNGGEASVSDELAVRVLAVADALGYVRNQAARALRGRRSGVVLIVTDPRTASVAALAAGMEEAGRTSGVTVSVTAVGSDGDAHLEALRILRGLRPLALVVTSASFAGTDNERVLAELELIRAEGANVVFVGEHDYDYPSIRFDDVAIGRVVAEHMATLGRERPAVLTAVHHPALESRTQGFLEGLTAHGYDAAAIAVETAEVSREGGRSATARLLARDERPDLILAGNDVLAIGALHALSAAGVRVPEDVAVSGVDDIPIAQDVTPSLTTVSLPFVEAGRAALTLALDPAAMDDVHLPATLMVRSSTAR
jgi:LacI family transcriptional regulator